MQYLARHGIALLALTIALAPTLISGQTLPAESSGTLDASFGTGGTVTTDFEGFNAAARAVAVQPDGKIVAAGLAAGRFSTNGAVDLALARYNPDGTLDASFGTGGIVTTPVDFPGSFDRVTSVVLQPDGKIVLAGSTLDVNFFANFALARFNSDGTLDASFGTGGTVTTSFGVSAEPSSVAVQADGKIVAAGEANVDGGEDFALVRYNSNGSLDATFGTGGKVTTAFPGPAGQRFAFAFSLAVQPDDRIVAAGYARTDAAGASTPSFDFVLARYNSNGTLDASFGTGGRVTTDFAGPNDKATSVAVQPDGRIVVAGQAGPYVNSGFDFALARYNGNGTLDDSFGTGGKATTDFAGFDDVPSSIALQGDGKIVVVGQTSVGDHFDFALARYNSNGTLDTGFGTGGKVTTDFAGSSQVPASVTLQGDGNIVVVGAASINGRVDFALARYLGSAVTSAPPRPDLVATAVTTTPSTPVRAPGTTFSVTDTVKNAGPAPSGPSTTRYYLSLDTVKNAGDTLLSGARPVPALAADATSSGSVTVTIPSTTPINTYYVLACADDLNTVVEADETNNCVASATAIVTLTRPDLVGTGVTSNPPAPVRAPGTTFSVTDTVKNAGGVPSGSSTTRYYLSLDAVKNAGDTLLGGRRVVPALAAGATSSGSVTVTIPPATQNNTYFLLACADDLKTLAEVDEANNCVASPTAIVRVTRPDLADTAVSAPPATKARGTTFQVTDTVQNLGAVAAGTSVTRYYLSLDVVKSASDTLLTGTRSIPALAAGASNSGTVTVTIPTTTPLNTYFLLVCADGLNTVVETNEANNCKASVTTVTVTP